MKSVKLDDDVYQNLVENKKEGGFKSISELVRYALTVTGEVFEEKVTERQERQLLRLKLAEIRTELHDFCQFMRGELANGVKIDGQAVELKAVGPELRAVMAVDKDRIINLK
jgi:Arc/MetJ-type ribon-helix-helix transcriptional regulator